MSDDFFNSIKADLDNAFKRGWDSVVNAPEVGLLPEVELRKWSVEQALRVGRGDVVGEAERIYQWVITKPEPAPDLFREDDADIFGQSWKYEWDELGEQLLSFLKAWDKA